MEALDKAMMEGRTTEPDPGSREYLAAWEIARRLDLEETKGATTEPTPDTPEYQGAMARIPQVLADDEVRDRIQRIFRMDSPNKDATTKRVLERWYGVPVTLKDGSRIPDPSSPTGYVMGPFPNLDPVAAAGQKIGFQVFGEGLTTLSKGRAEAKGRELVKQYIAQGGELDYQRRRDDTGKDGFLQLRQFRNISNVNVGVLCQQIGIMSKEGWLKVAGEYARDNASNYFPYEPYGLDPETRKYIEIGFDIGKRSYGFPALPIVR